MSAPPFPLGLRPRTAGLQVFGLLALFYGYLYGNALLAGEVRVGANPVLSVFVTGALMLLAVGLLVRRDADWRASLGMQRAPLGETIAFGGVGLMIAYAANIVATLFYAALHGGLVQMAEQKAQWASKLSELPLLWILPLAMFVGLWEELVFRGFLLGRLRVAFQRFDERTRDALAIGVSAALFGAGHGYQGLLGLIQTTIIGVALGALTVWRKSLWPAVIAHLAVDTFGLIAIKKLKPALEEILKKSL